MKKRRCDSSEYYRTTKIKRELIGDTVYSYECDEMATTVIYDDYVSSVNYTNFSLSGLLLAYAYAFAKTGFPFPYTSPSYRPSIQF